MSTEPGSRRLAALAFVLVVAACLTFPLLGARDLWAPDEPRYAQVAQEMLAGGHWWYPQVNARPYPDKPPLYFWLAAAAGSAGGRVSEAAARLPSALAHLVLVALTFWLGARLFGVRAGIVASLALATCWLEAWMARRACLDVLVSLCAMAAICAALVSGSAARAGRRALALSWAALAGIAVGLGFMTKGPVVLIAVGAALLPLAWHREARLGRPRGALAPALAIACLALAVVLLAWLVPARQLGGYDPVAIAKEQVLERATEGRHHGQPPWYFLGSVPPDFLPWTLLAVPAIAWAFRRRSQWREAMLLSWALLPVVIHSVIVEKRNIYVLPAAPAWALLCGAWVASLPAVTPALRRLCMAAAVLLAVVGLGAVVAPLVPLGGDAQEALALPGAATAVACLGLAALVGAAGIAFEIRSRAEPVRLAAALALAFAAVQFGLFVMLPRFDALKSGRTTGEAIRRLARDAPVGMYPRTWDAYVYYSGRPIPDLPGREEATAWLAKTSRPAFVLAYEKDLANLPPDGPSPPVSVFSDDVGHRVVHLLRYDSSLEMP